MFFFGFKILGRAQHQHLLNQQKKSAPPDPRA